MYTRFYGLRERPFELTSDPRYVFLSDTHREALTSLAYGIRGQKTVVLLGEAGTGKTTLVQALLARKPAAARAVSLTNPVLTRQEFLAMLAGGLGLPADAAASKARLLAELETTARAAIDAGGYLAIVVDEAQALPPDLLEELRLLTNLEAASRKLVSVVLCGQPELGERLNRRAAQAFKQRVSVRSVLRPLRQEETAAYIAARIRTAGGAGRIFTDGAVALVHERSQGIPRTIGVICENALVAGFAEGVPVIGADLVAETCRDFDLDETSDVLVAREAQGLRL